MKNRFQKILSANGVCSRRAAERLILQGRVRVNGQTASLGDGADLEVDAITVNGKRLNRPPRPVYLMLYKPRGYVTTVSDEKGRRTVMDLLEGAPERVYPVGRLDMDSEGLLLLTNDGALTQRLTHPSHEVEKEYLLCLETPEEDPAAGLTAPMSLDGRPLAPVKARLIRREEGKTWMTLTIREGRNRQIRRMCRQRGYRLLRLRRTAVGRLKLDKLPLGQWRRLTEEEIRYLQSL